MALLLEGAETRDTGLDRLELALATRRPKSLESKEEMEIKDGVVFMEFRACTSLSGQPVVATPAMALRAFYKRLPPTLQLTGVALGA